MPFCEISLKQCKEALINVGKKNVRVSLHFTYINFVQIILHQNKSVSYEIYDHREQWSTTIACWSYNIYFWNGIVQWAYCQIRKIAGCACAANAGNVFPATDFSGNRQLAIPACITARASHHDTCVTHVSWCMSESLTCAGGENVPGIPGACTTRNFTYLSRGPWDRVHGMRPRDLPSWNIISKIARRSPNLWNRCYKGNYPILQFAVHMYMCVMYIRKSTP